MKNARKPFVLPQIKEQASLAKVTLISGGGGGQPTFRKNKVNNHSNSHGHNS